MDITLLFKACIKSIKTKNRAFGQSTLDNVKSRILVNCHSNKEFATRSKEICQQITRLHDFLKEHQQAYLNFSCHLSGLNKMSESERDKLDAGAQKIIHSCSSLINELENDITVKLKPQNQVLEHQNIVISLMKRYLKQICKIYSKQKAIHIHNTLELRKLSKIDSNNFKKEFFTAKSVNLQEKPNDIDNKSNIPSYLQNEDLSSEELQMFELENNELYNELNSLSDEIKQIESKVLKIAELQELFTEKVLEQDKDMDRVAAMVVGSTENVKDANEQIRQAIQRNAGLRVWILFFLLVMSFSLLFLDWYND